ncbi:MAG: spore coat protein U domain-containing protein [Betaproteobacteria bacterium]|nr:spore coat protein U domain-containing protein [Betaproteobacteria bacterium]
MKKLLLVAALGFSSLIGGVAHAGTTTGTFNVNITLTTACTLTTINDLNFAYTSFQAAAATPTSGGGFSVTCTNGVPYTFGLDALTTTDDAVNLTYTLSLPTPAAGTGAAQAYTIGGSIAASQGGTCASLGSCTNAAATNRQRTLTVTF